MIVKIYGIVDLLAAALLFFGNVPFPEIGKIIIILILLIKGVPSLVG